MNNEIVQKAVEIDVISFAIGILIVCLLVFLVTYCVFFTYQLFKLAIIKTRQLNIFKDKEEQVHYKTDEYFKYNDIINNNPLRISDTINTLKTDKVIFINKDKAELTIQRFEDGSYEIYVKDGLLINYNELKDK